MKKYKKINICFIFLYEYKKLFVNHFLNKIKFTYENVIPENTMVKNAILENMVVKNVGLKNFVAKKKIINEIRFNGSISSKFK